MFKTICIRAQAILRNEEHLHMYFLWRVEQDVNLFNQIDHMMRELKKQEEPRRMAFHTAFDKGEGREFTVLHVFDSRTELLEAACRTSSAPIACSPQPSAPTS